MNTVIWVVIALCHTHCVESQEVSAVRPTEKECHSFVENNAPHNPGVEYRCYKVPATTGNDGIFGWNAQ